MRVGGHSFFPEVSHDAHDPTQHDDMCRIEYDSNVFFSNRSIAVFSSDKIVLGHEVGPFRFVSTLISRSVGVFGVWHVCRSASSLEQNICKPEFVPPLPGGPRRKFSFFTVRTGDNEFVLLAVGLRYTSLYGLCRVEVV